MHQISFYYNFDMGEHTLFLGKDWKYENWLGENVCLFACLLFQDADLLTTGNISMSRYVLFNANTNQ